MISIPKFNDDGWYCCPFCGSEYTHQGKVEVFGRSEDDEKPNHVIVDTYNITVDRSNENNPSIRRGGVSIKFWCEGCGCIHYLTIAQHKGNTLIEIVDKKGNPVYSR